MCVMAITFSIKSSRFTRHKGLVDRTAAFEDGAIERHTLAEAHAQAVADHYLIEADTVRGRCFRRGTVIVVFVWGCVLRHGCASEPIRRA
jgi:hypothetical protein